MDLAEIERLIKCLKSPSSKLIDVLLQIRTRVIKTDEGVRTFRECGGLASLVPLLRKTNERVLDVVLSTLGNCCMEEEGCLELGKLITSNSLIQIIKSIKRDSIVGRTCRLIGNIAQQKVNAKQLHSDGIVAALLTVIVDRDKTTTHQTLIMAVRAIRLLWMVTEKRDEMLKSSVVRTIAILLTTECENADLIKPLYEEKKTKKVTPNKDRSELFAGILKCLGFFTTLTSFECAEQIQGDGRGYKCLVILTNDHQSSALKCIINLCYVATSRPVLGNAGAISCIVRLLESQTPDWPDSWVRALCMLCRESVNRAKVRESGGLQMLLAVTKDTSNIPRHSDALHALLQFVFDDIGFQILMKKGLVSIVGQQLKDYIATMKCEHQPVNSDPKNTNVSLKCLHIEDNFKKIKTKEESPISPRTEVSQLDKNNEDKRKIVIERDNMMINFNDRYESDTHSDSSDADSNAVRSPRKKRCRTPSLNNSTKNLSLQKMARYDWSLSGVSYEIKHSDHQNQSSPNLSPLSGYSCGHSATSSWLNSQLKFVDQVTSRSRNCAANDGSPESPDGGASSPSYWNPGQWSPGSSQSFCYSPKSEMLFDEDSSDSEKSGRYSPVCSDVEEPPQNQSPEKLSDLSTTLMNDMDKLIMDDEILLVEELKIEDTTGQQTRSHRACCLLILLSRVSHSETGLEKLTSKDILNSLIVYVARSKYPLNRAARIMARLAGNASHLVKMIENRLVMNLYKLQHQPRHAECKQCKQLQSLSKRLINQMTMLAESDYGIGEICYQIQKGSPDMKQTLAVSLPYLICSERPLKKLLINYEALDLLFNLVILKNESLESCVPSFSQLASNLQIKDPISLETQFKDHILLDYDPSFDGVESDDIVEFLLDDHSTVVANKHFLCQESEVFSAMFSGSFKESSEKSVRLKNVSKSGLEYLLTLLHSGVNSEINAIETFPLPTCVLPALDALLLADRFLMEKLKNSLFSAIVQFQMNSDTADQIYKWSLEEGMGILCVESVAHILTGQMTDSQRLRTFSSLMESNYKEQWIDDLKSILLRHFC